MISLAVLLFLCVNAYFFNVSPDIKIPLERLLIYFCFGFELFKYFFDFGEVLLLLLDGFFDFLRLADLLAVFEEVFFIVLFVAC